MEKLLAEDDRQSGVKKYRIHWLCNALGSETDQEASHLGICEHTKAIAFIAFESFIPLIVGDLYVREGQGCEEGTRCLDLGCDLNRTTFTSYKKATEIGRTLKRKWQFDNLVRRLKELISPHFRDAIQKIDWSEQYMSVYEEPELILQKVKK